jgi:hypothetical protein
LYVSSVQPRGCTPSRCCCLRRLLHQRASVQAHTRQPGWPLAAAHDDCAPGASNLDITLSLTCIATFQHQKGHLPGASGHMEALPRLAALANTCVPTHSHAEAPWLSAPCVSGSASILPYGVRCASIDKGYSAFARPQQLMVRCCCLFRGCQSLHAWCWS